MRNWDDPLNFKEEGIVIDYKTAGVDIDAGNEFVEKLREKAPGIGGFGGMIKIPSGYDEPILVCLLYTSPSPRDRTRSRMPSSA